MLIDSAVFFWWLVARPLTLLQAKVYCGHGSIRCHVRALGPMQAITILIPRALFVKFPPPPSHSFLLSLPTLFLYT